MRRKLFSSIILAFGFLLVFFAKDSFAATLYWVGNNGANASVASNWKTTDPVACGSGDASAIPGVADTMIFDADCDNGAVIDSSFSSTVNILQSASGYTGTITLSNPLTIASTSSTALSLSGGVFNSTSQVVTLSGSGGFVVATGTTYRAPSTTQSFPGPFTVSSTGTFDVTTNSGGTVNFNGGTATLGCGGTTFNLVTINSTSGTKTVGTDCNLALGSNPTATVTTMNLNGTLSGAGTLTISATLTFNNSAATLSGFSGISVGSTLNVQGSANVDLSSYSSVVLNAVVLTSAAGTVTFPSGTDINGALTISGGTFNAPSGTMTLAGSLTVSGGTGTFNANAGTITFDGSTATIGCTKSDASVISFNLVTFNNSGTKTISSGCILPLGDNPNLSSSGNIGSVTLNGTLSGSGTLTKFGTFTFNSGAALSGFSAINHNTNTLIVSGATLDLSSYTSVSTGFFTLSSGTFMAPASTMTNTGNFTHSGGTFNHSNGTVIWQNNLGQSDTRTKTGSTTFYNLQIIPTADNVSSTRLFTAGTTQTVLGTFTVQKMSLASSSAGSQWNIDAQGGRVLQNLNVQDSNNVNSNVMIASNSIDSGNNTNWLFTSAPVISFALDYPGGESHITNTRPTFRWKKATASVNSSIVKYQLWVDNTAANSTEIGDFNIDNIVPSVSDINGNNKTLEYDRYTLHDDGDYLNLTTKSSNLWTDTQSDGELTLGKKNWRIVAYDSAGNVQEESVDFYVDAVTVADIPSYVGGILVPIKMVIEETETSPENPNLPQQSKDAIPIESRIPVTQKVSRKNLWLPISLAGLLSGIFVLFMFFKRRVRH